MDKHHVPRVRFAHLPTPVEPLSRLSAALGGPELWIKRDDQTGLAFGGNKTRKLEFLVAEAQARGARTLITVGSVQSNHCRQTAAAAARFGFGCILVLDGEPSAPVDGNLLLDRLMGAEIVWTEGRGYEQVLQETFDHAQESGRRPYRIPMGGSNMVGAAAYVEAMAEFLAQRIEADRIVVATSSGGTQAGMLAGAKIHGFKGRITGIRVAKLPTSEPPNLIRLAEETAAYLGKPVTIEADDVLVFNEYLGEAYARMTEGAREAIATFARTEGVFLDPIYTGRAAAGMIDLIHRGEITPDERVLFWHTGGTPALFAFSDQLS